METALWIIASIILLPFLLDFVIPESHILQSILNNVPAYCRFKDWCDDHSRSITICLFIVGVFFIYPICFSWGYNTKEKEIQETPPSISLINIISDRFQPSSIHWQLKHYQLFTQVKRIKIDLPQNDSIVYDRIARKFIHKPTYKPEEKPFYNYSFVPKIIAGLAIIPSWKDIKNNYSFSSNGKKPWLICLLALGYLGYHQGYEYKSLEYNQILWEEINSDEFWQDFCLKYPYEKLELAQ